MIRSAEKTDLEGLVELGRQMHAESNYAPLTFSELIYRRFLETLIDHELGCVLVADRQGQVIGVYIGVVSNAFFSMDRIAQDVLLYVDPEHRGGMTAMRLIKAFEDWAAKQGAVQVRPGISVGGPIEVPARLYIAAGYQTAGYTFVKNL